MKKMTLKMWLLGGFVAIASLCATSCAEGADCDERFSGGVTNTQLAAPEVEGFVISSQTNSDGSESLVVEWPVVNGAGGYLVTVAIVDDPANPVFLPFESQAASCEGENAFVDGCRIIFEKREDTNYEVRVKSAANNKLNNKESAEAAVLPYSTLVPAEKIPHATDSDIAVYINKYLADNAETLKASHEADMNFEIAFELEAGKEYTMSETIDFGLISTTIRTESKVNHARIVMGEGNISFTTQAGLKLKFIDVDMLKSTSKGFICLSPNPDESIKDANLKYKGGSATYKQLGASKGNYIIEDPIVVQNCLVKDVPQNFIWDSKKKYGVMDFRVTGGSIIQQQPTAGQFIQLQESGGSMINNLTIQESTIYRAEGGGSGYYFFRAGRQNRTKVFGSAASTSDTRFLNASVVLIGVGKNFTDGVQNDGGNVNTVHNSIFVNAIKFERLYGSFDCKNTTVFSNTSSGDSNKYDADFSAAGEGPFDPYASYNFGSLDLTQPNGGVDFTPQGKALSEKRGDPRWL